MNISLRLWQAGIVALCLSYYSAVAEELMMVRTEQPFVEAMSTLQEMIRKHGYQLIRVQRVDVGLQSRGFPTAEYRVVFLGKRDEIDALTRQYPELMPYLPLKVTLFAEGDNTLAVTSNPTWLSTSFRDKELQPYFNRWERDLRTILDQFAEQKR